MERGKVVRSQVHGGAGARAATRMGVVFAKPDPGDRIIAIARNTERTLSGDDGELPAAPDGPGAGRRRRGGRRSGRAGERLVRRRRASRRRADRATRADDEE